MLPRRANLRTLFLLLTVINGPRAVVSLRANESTPDGVVIAETETHFETRIRPILAGKCFKCHGGEKTSGGLRVDSREALLQGGDSGPAIVAGDPAASLLHAAIRYADDGPQMPPDERLGSAVADDFAKWIHAGAEWPAKASAAGAPFAPRHWAFEPVIASEPPVDPTGKLANPIDRFIAARRTAAGLQPVAPADKRTLLRRVTFDLIGLPPTPDELDDFAADEAPGAWDRAVERLLASPHYGERWGRHWMDVAHYADTAGDNADYPVPEARRYRDYVIDAFNADKPYDDFIREQIAGDILAADGPTEKFVERTVATGYLALSRRYATAPFELWHLTLEDTLDTLGSSILGLTLRCARCHDHKFDPITTEDYYALYGFFASTQFPYAGSEETNSKQKPRTHFVPLVSADEFAPRMAAYAQAVADLEAAYKQAQDDKADEKQLARFRKELRALRTPGSPADLPVAYAVQEGKPTDVAVQVRGEPSQPGPVVPRGVPKFLTDGKALEIPAGTSGRRELAEWLVSPANPLTSRVMVNRVWQHHFGRGLVATPSNFGLRGAEPTHPELVDWLANYFVSNNWSIKALHRLILSSQTYQLASDHGDVQASTDPGNDLYWRYNRRRLDAEALRDAMLAVSGKLDVVRPADHPFPASKDWKWTQHAPFKGVYPSNHRSVYLMTQRIQRHPYLALFDGPDTNHSTDVRTSSTVPLQALYLMNNPFVAEQASAFATRLLQRTGDESTRIRHGCELAWGRLPSAAEQRRLLDFVAQYRQALDTTTAAGESRELDAWTSLSRVLLTANAFVYVD